MEQTKKKLNINFAPYVTIDSKMLGEEIKRNGSKIKIVK